MGSVVGDLIEQRLQKPAAVNDGDDEYLAALDAIDEPVAVDEALAERVIVEFGHDASGVREGREVSGRFEELVDHGVRIGRRVAVDVLGDGIDVIECRGRPAYADVH